MDTTLVNRLPAESQSDADQQQSKQNSQNKNEIIHEKPPGTSSMKFRQ